ncbi:MAG: hypothetical protein H7257_09180 [Taibaiella sp.]|nr:hypothetical protein [Taibaiella sp.]
MKKIIVSGLVAGFVLVFLLVVGLYVTIWFFPGIAMQYFDPAFDSEAGRMRFYYLHPFVLSLALSWFWARFKSALGGSFLTRAIEFALIYLMVAIFPMMWLIYSAMNVPFLLVAMWFIFAFVQALIAALVFEKMNP